MGKWQRRLRGLTTSLQERSSATRSSTSTRSRQAPRQQQPPFSPKVSSSPLRPLRHRSSRMHQRLRLLRPRRVRRTSSSPPPVARAPAACRWELMARSLRMLLRAAREAGQTPSSISPPSVKLLLQRRRPSGSRAVQISTPPPPSASATPASHRSSLTAQSETSVLVPPHPSQRSRSQPQLARTSSSLTPVQEQT